MLDPTLKGGNRDVPRHEDALIRSEKIRQSAAQGWHAAHASARYTEKQEPEICIQIECDFLRKVIFKESHCSQLKVIKDDATSRILLKRKRCLHETPSIRKVYRYLTNLYVISSYSILSMSQKINESS